MARADAELEAADQLLRLAGRLKAADGFVEVVASLRAGHGATFDGVWGSSRALLAASLAGVAPSCVVVVCAHAGEIDDFVDDLANFTPIRAERFSPSETEGISGLTRDDAFGDRLRVLKLLNGDERPKLIVSSIQSLLQPVPEADRIREQTRVVRVGETVDAAALARLLVERGFQSTSGVELPGEFSLRGGILDVFAADWFDPVRIEFFGDEVESIRRFEVSTQRSLESLDAVEITTLAPSPSDRAHFADALPKDAWFLLIEPGDIEEEGRHYLQRLERPQDVHGVAPTMRQIYRFPSATAAAVAITSMETTCRLKIESVERFSGDVAKVRNELDTAGEGHDVFVVCQTDAEVRRLSELFEASRLAQQGRLKFPLGRLRAGFRLVTERVVVVSGAELFHRSDIGRPSRRRLGKAIDSFLDLREGDYVVHLTHGVGRYLGIRALRKEDQVEEHLEVEFDGGTKIYVPTSKIELVQKYVGGTKSRPTLAKIGGKSWLRQKSKVEEAVTDLASDMLDLQASRAARVGITFPADTEWQKEFDASFPYQETPDQLAAISAIKLDMVDPKPMDRLICGDVGFGKTEVAMRAAFKAIDAGYQVAILAPTTVLAEQHGRTFKARMAEFPFQVGVLSRFNTAKEQRALLEGMAEGSVDVVIGTHRLAQGDVAFRNLGLLIIDEEQRFGVAVKERLKAYRSIVDVLTMTATPIPRTLHMSLLGLRDISNLETPPADRLAIETRVMRFDEAVIRHAILRELNRDGQIFFVHNRVRDIERVATKLREIVPEARIAIGHGQMSEGALEEVMLEFVDHKYDILLATTIIESGLDIPNANTIFIDRADQYGLAELHQLRGRVGRYKHRAYCYMLLDPARTITTTAAKRLKAIEEFSEMGAGFAIAMRDLEIRGAGNILGAEQSGHIATVGYELYCDLLEKTVRRLKNLPQIDQIDVNIDLPGEAVIPRRYVPDMRAKIDVYRRLARMANLGELADLRNEIADRFGPIPEPVERLLSTMELRILAHGWGVHSIHLEEGFAVLGYRDRGRMEKLVAEKRGKLRIVDALSAYLPVAAEETAADAIRARLKALLLPAD